MNVERERDLDFAAKTALERLRPVALQEVADYLGMSLEDADALVSAKNIRIRLSVMAWGEDDMPLFDTECGTLDKAGRLEIPPRRFMEAFGWPERAETDA